MPPDTFHRLRIYLNCVCGWGYTPEIPLCSPEPLFGFKWAASQWRGKGRVERGRGKGSGNKGKGRKRMEGAKERGVVERKERSGLCPPLAKIPVGSYALHDVRGTRFTQLVCAVIAQLSVAELTTQ